MNNAYETDSLAVPGQKSPLEFETAARDSEKERRTPTVYVREVCVQYVGPRRKSVAIKESAHAKLFFDGIQKDNAIEHFMAALS